jgi:hypothetical protein
MDGWKLLITPQVVKMNGQGTVAASSSTIVWPEVSTGASPGKI